MKISAFSFVRNGDSLYYPVVESIRSALPLCHEFVIAVGKGDPGDRTRERIAEIGDSRIRILDTVWDMRHFERGAVNARQTDIAREACTGDWLLYLQADEVIHERYLPAIRRRCEELHHDAAVEGLLFRFRHFWGDYEHYFESHAWYNEEIRCIRNLPEIHSWHSAQSFRYFHRYDGPWQASNTRKLRVARANAEIYHYGWVRPPHLMQRKKKALRAVHAGPERADAQFASRPQEFDYGPLETLPVFTESHPAVMRERIAALDWRDKLRLDGPRPRGTDGDGYKHYRLKYRFLTTIERLLFGGRQVFGSRNYRLVRC